MFSYMSLWFSIAFPWWLKTFNILSDTYKSSVCPLWWSVHSCHLPIFLLGFFVFSTVEVWVLHICILVYCQIYCLQCFLSVHCLSFHLILMTFDIAKFRISMRSIYHFFSLRNMIWCQVRLLWLALDPEDFLIGFFSETFIFLTFTFKSMLNFRIHFTNHHIHSFKVYSTRTKMAA